jgi:hypothetical protein
VTVGNTRARHWDRTTHVRYTPSHHGERLEIHAEQPKVLPEHVEIDAEHLKIDTARSARPRSESETFDNGPEQPLRVR